MSRPSDHFDSPERPADLSRDATITQPRLGVVGYVRFFWRQLTSMRTALFLLLLLAIATVPGSLVPQRTADPNGVIQYFKNNPRLAPILDSVQGFDVYSSVWFSAIYLLLFVSLVGCVIPRMTHHLKALRTPPPRTPARLDRLEAFQRVDAPLTDSTAAIESARRILRKSGYRVRVFDGPGAMSVSAERGYLRETGNLVFHGALVGVLVSVGIVSGFGYGGQKVIIEGDSFANVLLSYESFLPGRFFDDQTLAPYRIRLNDFDVKYEVRNRSAIGQPIDYTADVTTFIDGPDSGKNQVVKVNAPLPLGGDQVYLLGNGYAPTITVRDPAGTVIFTESVPFLPQDGNLTSIGVVKVPDGLSKQLGLVGFFYPTAAPLATGALTSSYPDLLNPVLSLQAYTGDLGLDAGIPRSVYALNTDGMTEIAGRTADTPSLELTPGATVQLPGGLGSVTFENEDPTAGANNLGGSVLRFASFDIRRDPSQIWVLSFAMLVLGGLLTSLFVPRRRVWVKAQETDAGIRLEYAGLARGDDPGLERAVEDIADKHAKALELPPQPGD